MHEGKSPLEANSACFEDLEDDTSIHDNKEYHEHPNLPPDLFALHFDTDTPRILGEALRDPNAKEWQAAYDYEINQLLKMEVLIIENLLAGKTAIPYSLIFKEKLGATENVESF